MRIAVVALLAIALSGCFGIPEGSADFGDKVTIQYVVLDPATQAPLAWSLQNVPVSDIDGHPHYNGVALNAQVNTRLGNDVPSQISSLFVATGQGGFQPVDKATFDGLVRDLGLLMSFGLNKEFIMGSGASGLGFDIERGLIGVSVNETTKIVSNDDPSRGFSSLVTRVAELGGGDMMRSIPRTQFEGSLGTPTIGQVFQLDQVVSAEVTSFDNATVNTRVTLQDGEEFPADIVGSRVVARVGPVKYAFILEPVEGETFTINANPTGTPLDLAAGTYRSVGVQGANAVWAFSATPAHLVDVPIEVHAKITKITRNDASVPEGEYGVRSSSVMPHVEVINDHHHGEEPAHVDAGHSDGHDDGHGDHTH